MTQGDGPTWNLLSLDARRLLDTRMARTWCLGAVLVLIGALYVQAQEPTRYLAFQIFTGSFDSDQMREAIPPPAEDLRKIVLDLRERIQVPAARGRRLAFVLGPIAFDNPDDEVRTLIDRGFAIATETGVAVGFHIDDSMFWGRLKELNTPDNLEWLDWNRTPSTGRRLDWSSHPLKIMPQLCFNSNGVRTAVSARARLIGREVSKGVGRLSAGGGEELFLGVIAGWETQIGRDFESGKYLGYHALANAGFSAANPPAEPDLARCNVVHEFVEFWAHSLIQAGVPRGKVYSHIAYMSEALYQIARQHNSPAAAVPYLRAINFSPPASAFSKSCTPGLSTYPQPGHLEQWFAELRTHGNPRWASCEGTAVDPAQAERRGIGKNMEHYLGNLFNHGAVVVNVFGWRVGGRDNSFRITAENDRAVSAYRKFLRGEELAEAMMPVPLLPPVGLQQKIKKLQSTLPAWIEKHGPTQVKENVDRLERALRSQRFEDAEKAANALLKTIDSER
jgi:hypothetical protein